MADQTVSTKFGGRASAVTEWDQDHGNACISGRLHVCLAVTDIKTLFGCDSQRVGHPS